MPICKIAKSPSVAVICSKGSVVGAVEQVMAANEERAGKISQSMCPRFQGHLDSLLANYWRHGQRESSAQVVGSVMVI